MNKVTIGGDRLGSGNKMKQAMHGYERSNHDLSYNWRSTMAPGTLVPCLSKVGLPGDTFEIDLESEVLTHPTIAPLFGSFKLQIDIFSVPVRLYQAQLHNNKTGIGLDMSKVKLPLLDFHANNLDFTEGATPLDLQQINPSSLFAYLGIRGLGNAGDRGNVVNVRLNAIPYLAYWDIYKNYYTNKQEEIGAFIDYEETPIVVINESYFMNRNSAARQDPPYQIQDITYMVIQGENLDQNSIILHYEEAGTGIAKTTTPAEAGEVIERSSTGLGVTTLLINFNGNHVGDTFTDAIVGNNISMAVPPQITTFPLSNLDDMREDILADIKNTNAFLINGETYAPYGNSLASTGEGAFGENIRSVLPMQGLALKTYQSDLFNNWLSTEFIDGVNGISEITKVDTTDGLKLDTLNLAQKVYNMLNRIAISGGTYYNWIEAVYDQNPYNTAETPVYHGGLSREIVFQEVISNSESDGQPLGTLAGKGIQSREKKGGHVKIKLNEHSYIIGIVSITPRIDYSQGNNWDVNLNTMDDFHKPALDGIGFQDLITDGMAAWDTFRDTAWTPEYRSAGKQPAWINYMTSVNQCYGHFADERSEMFMTLNRRYEVDYENQRIKDLTTYIDPAKFNYTFAQTDRSAQNFWVQIGHRIKARRKMSAKQIPNL